MAIKLTTRQRLLMKRLVRLGDMANDNELPVRPTEIRGFGSFFRGKPRPHDVDLLIKEDFRTKKPEFECLIKVLKRINYDWDLENQFQTPRDAIAELVSTQDLRISEIADLDIELLKRWISPYSWNMLRPQTMAAQSAFDSPRAYTNRMLKGELPNINVLSFMGPSDGDKLLGMRCGFTVRVWSIENPDTKANLDELMTETSMRKNALVERAFFLTQIPMMTASVRFHEAEIALLKRLPTQQPATRDPWRWFDDFSKGHPDLAAATLELERTRNVRNGVEECDVADDGSPLIELATEVDRLRKKLKHLYAREEQLESLRNTLAYYRSGAENDGLNVDDFVVYKMLHRGSKVAKLKRKEFLESMGYPVDDMMARFTR